MSLQLEPQTVFIESERGVERGAWVHVALDQVADVFPHVKYGKYCETPRCAHQLHPALILHAVFYTKRLDTWVSCWDCFQIMLGTRT